MSRGAAVAVGRYDGFTQPIHRALGDSTTVYTKAGWTSGEGDLYALNDGGIVRRRQLVRTCSVMTDACGRNDLLTERWLTWIRCIPAPCWRRRFATRFART